MSHNKDTSALLANFTNGTKIHARVLANGKDTVGEASAAYPIYVTSESAALSRRVAIANQWPQCAITLGTNTWRRRIQIIQTNKYSEG